MIMNAGDFAHLPFDKHEGLHPTDFSVVAFGSSSEITSDFEEGSGIQLAQKSEHDIAPCDHVCAMPN